MRYTRQSLENIELKTLHLQLKQIRDDLGKSNKEICDAFIKTSGDTKKMRMLLDDAQKKPVVIWTPLEDMALTEPDTSVEF